MVENTDWYNVFDGNTSKFICQVGVERGKEPVMHDPRIGGSGCVIWQKTDEKIG